MRDILTLTRLSLLSLFGINKFCRTRDKKEKKRYYFLLAAWIILGLVLCFYIGGLVFGLYTFSLSHIVPAYLTVLSSLLILLLGLFRAEHEIFGRHGYNLLASLPVRTEHIVISRLLVLYLTDLALTLAVFVPALIVYGLLMTPAVAFYFSAVVGILLVPVLPLVLSVLFGTVIFSLSSRSRHKNLIRTILTVGFLVVAVGGSIFLPTNADAWDPEKIMETVGSLGDTLGTFYPPAAWLSDAMLGISGFGLLFLALLSAAMGALCFVLCARLFHPIVSKLSETAVKKDYRLGALSSRSLLKALYFREARHYFSSSLYVTNTIIGPIMGCLASVTVLVMGRDTLSASLPPNVPIETLLPYGLATIFCTMPTTAPSLSMEGKGIDVLRPLPIPVKTLFDSKILWNLSLMLPCYAVSEILLTIALRPTLAEWLPLGLIPLCLMTFSAVFGITADLKFHRFDWTKESEVVKQGASAAIGGFGGMLLSLLCSAVIWAVPTAYSLLGHLVMAAILIVLTLWLYRQNSKARPEYL